MVIGVFSKLGASGGSEHRCAEMCNAVVRHTQHAAVLLCERELNDLIRQRLDPRVTVYTDVLKRGAKHLERLYEVDCLLVVNSDSYSFSKLEYWEGKTEHHNHRVDLSKVRQMVFLYNFVISPASKLHTIERKCKDVRVVCGNKDFFRAVGEESKFERVTHLPRMILDSPIDPGTITTGKTPSGKVRIGKHSKAHGYKFNPDHADLIRRVNDAYPDAVEWDFMGVPTDRARELRQFPNVTIRPEYSTSVRDYLAGIDVFLFFIAWDRKEPWSRAVAEGMTAGCPVLATDKAGNRDQVVHRNSGYLCGSVDDFAKWIGHLVENRDRIGRLGRNGALYARQFTSDKIIAKFMTFIGADGVSRQ